MKNRLLVLVLIASFFYLPCIYASAPKKNQNIVLFESEDTIAHKELALYSPVDLTTSGIHSFLQNVYNHQDYSAILGHNLSHLNQFLQHGKNTKQSHAYVKSLFKLFGNKLKESNYIDAQAFSAFLGQMPNLISHNFLQKHADQLDHHKEHIHSILYQTFLSKYDFFKKSPDEFFNKLSSEILNALQEDMASLNGDVTAQELRSSVIRFLELSLGKILWKIEDKEKIWDSFKTISKQLETLVAHNIINDVNDLDDLFWSLTHRFKYFMDLAHTQLPLSFYDYVKKDLAVNNFALLEMEEQEPLIQSKGTIIAQTIVQCQAKKQALDKGMILR